MRAPRPQNLSRHQKIFFAKASFTQRLPLYGTEPFLDRFLGEGARLNSQNGKSPLPGGQARRNKLLVSWGPLVIAAPLAGSLLAPLRCAARNQASQRFLW